MKYRSVYMNDYIHKEREFNSETGDFCPVSSLEFIVFLYVCGTTSVIK